LPLYQPALCDSTPPPCASSLPPWPSSLHLLTSAVLPQPLRLKPSLFLLLLILTPLSSLLFLRLPKKRLSSS
jgi:hypothetical protein